MVITEFQGVLAGIGDINTGVNVIHPYFDAIIRNFIVGQDGIIDGFTVLNDKLQSGACIAQGYVGVYDGKPIEIPTGYKVYGKFEVNHDGEVLDKFYVVVTSGDLDEQADILHEPGVFYLPLTNANRLKYPAKAHKSDTATTVLAGGKLLAGVTGVTQEVDDKSDKHATTEFVQNQIKKDINYDAVDKTFTYSTTQSGATLALTISYSVKRKSKYCIIPQMAMHCTSGGGGFSLSNGTILGKLEDGFYPKTDLTVVLSVSQQRIYPNPKITIKADGNIYVGGSGVQGDLYMTPSDIYQANNIGYETE